MFVLYNYLPEYDNYLPEYDLSEVEIIAVSKDKNKLEALKEELIIPAKKYREEHDEYIRLAKQEVAAFCRKNAEYLISRFKEEEIKKLTERFYLFTHKSFRESLYQYFTRKVTDFPLVGGDMPKRPNPYYEDETLGIVEVKEI